MQIILTEDVQNLGRSGEVVNVKPGYGRNYLIPRGLAVFATTKNLARIDHEQDRIGQVDRRVGLRAHPAGQRLRRGLLEARGVDDGEVEIAEAGLALAPIARHPRPVVDKRKPPANQAVE